MRTRIWFVLKNERVGKTQDVLFLLDLIFWFEFWEVIQWLFTACPKFPEILVRSMQMKRQFGPSGR